MDFEKSGDDSKSDAFSFRGDAAMMDPYRDDDVISDRQQSILNELKNNVCHEDLTYLNDHKEIEAIASLLLIDILKKSPKNPYAHAFNYLKNPKVADLVANFKRSKDFQYEKMLEKDHHQYATAVAAAKIAASKQKSSVTVDERSDMTEDCFDETDEAVDQYNLSVEGGETDAVVAEEAEMTVFLKE